MKKSSNDIYEYFIRLYDEDEFEVITRTSNLTRRFEVLLNYACNAVHSWRDLFKLCEDYPLLRLKTDIIAQLKIDTLPLIEAAQDIQTLQSHLSNYFDRLSILTDKAERELKRLENKDESVLEWLEDADSYDEFMSEFKCGFLEGTSSYFKAQKQYALEKINEWYLELKEELTDSDNKEACGVLKCRKMLQEVKKLKNTYISLINEATEENAFEIAVFDFSTFSSKLQNEIENFDEDDEDEDDDDEDENDEDDKEERREERIEKVAMVAGAVANGAGVAVKSTGKIIWKIISFPFVLIGKFFKFLFCTKFGRFLLALIILSGAGIAVWQTKIYEPVVDWVTGIFSSDENTPDDNPPKDIQDFIFELNSNDTYTLKKYNGNETAVVIPKTFNNKKVAVIGILAFENCQSITTLTISENITAIESSAFANCAYLETVYWNATNCEKAGEYNDAQTAYYTIFYGCENLKEIIFSENVLTIPSHTFRGCSKLTSIYIPANVKEIGFSAFNGCSELKSMTIPFVGGQTFSTGYSNVYLFGYIFGDNHYPGGVATFQSWSDWEGRTYYIPSNLKTVTVLGGNIAYGAFCGCNELEELNLCEGITKISEYAFEECTKLKTIVISQSVTSIGDYAFSDCNELTNVTLSAFALNHIPKTNLQKVTITNGIISEEIFQFHSKLRSVVLLNGVTAINSFAFYGCDNLKSIIIPDSVTYIGGYVFSNCSSLTIYCVTISKPSGWDSGWNSSNCPVVWGYKNN